MLNTQYAPHPIESRKAGGRLLPWVVAGSAAAVILVEVTLTRLFSVLLYYHYSFLAVALALFGLAAGGISASREQLDEPDKVMLQVRGLLRRASIALLGLILVLVLTSPANQSILVSLAAALVSAVPLFLLGKALALTMALGRARIHRLYAIDLVSGAVAALLTIPLLEEVQGPLALAAPALIGIILDAFLAGPGRRVLPSICALTLAIVLGYASSQDRPLLPLRDDWLGDYVLERWNAHSRVRVSDWTPGHRYLVIDKTAASLIPYAPERNTEHALSQAGSALDDPSYRLGRSPKRVAIIGVGGGPDILSALAAGATGIDGFELNGRIVELLLEGMGGYVTLAHRPGVRLIHDEARHALQHRPQQYDVIRANLIDTWAATAAGGFVLAENGIYTVEAWRLFLSRLTRNGVLVTTRWYLPNAPAEAQRLVALAAEALEAEGLPAERHLAAIALPSALDDPVGGRVQTITTVVSRPALKEREVTVLKEFAKERGGKLLWPSQPLDSSAQWAALLSPSSRHSTIRASRWAIEPPTDERPFFFLQLRPRDVLGFPTGDLGEISAITLNGVRILLAAVLLALAVAVILTIVAIKGRPGSGAALPASGQAYFALLGIGYMTVQLALMQRLSVILGHPLTTLALVLATMLVGTGLGSAIAGARPLRDLPAGLLALPPVVLGTLILGYSQVGTLSLSSLTTTAVACGGLAGLTGIALGVAFPTGIRLFAVNDAAVTEAWALNGAFSVLGSVLGALGGLLLGSRGLLVVALPCYLLAWTLVLLRRRSQAKPIGVRLRPNAA
jgi:hypothetical protein